MMKVFAFFISTLLLLTSNSFGQASKSSHIGVYVVDSNIRAVVNEKVKSLNGITMSSMDFKMYKNDSIVGDTYSNGKSIDQCMIYTTLEADTISIVGFMGMFAGFGYHIALFKDSCIVTHFAKSDADIYKLHQNDSLAFGISVPCKNYKLILSKKPTFKKGEVIEGVIELTSDEYYEVSNGEESKDRMQLTGYFRTDPIETVEDKYNKIKDK